MTIESVSYPALPAQIVRGAAPVYQIKPQWFLGDNWRTRTSNLVPNQPIKIQALFEWSDPDLPFRQWARVIRCDSPAWAWEFVPVAYIQRVR